MIEKEKAKRYDEAIEKLRGLHDDYDSVSTLIDIKEQLEYIFPELAESEDERIREAIIDTLNRVDQRIIETNYGIKHKDAVAWLEKQGKQKPVEWKQENVEELSDFENAMMHIGGSFFGEYAGLDPNDTALIKEQAELLLKLVPKQDWSEEDEAKLKSACALIRNTSLNGNEGVVDSTIDWLKSLKEK